MDAYKPRKVGKDGRHFVFVRFIDVDDFQSLEDRLNKVWIGPFKLKANAARFLRTTSGSEKVSGSRTQIEWQRYGINYVEEDKLCNIHTTGMAGVMLMCETPSNDRASTS
ncbi:hypothetical protein Ancab_038960 [Ancistrocladus abbreviatus]